MPVTLQRIPGLPFQFGGEEHSGWLPPGAAVPRPTPIQNVLPDLEIQRDESGYLLIYTAQDGSFGSDYWFHTLAEAEQTAEEIFGVQRSQWQRV